MVAAATNLNAMRNSINGSQAQAVTGVINEAWLIAETAGKIVTVGDIYNQMKTRDDQITALHFFNDSARHYAKQVDLSLPWINTYLTAINNPAALAEATKVRDKMLELHLTRSNSSQALNVSGDFYERAN